jgi:sugar diacid utilization regulator
VPEGVTPLLDRLPRLIVAIRAAIGAEVTAAAAGSATLDGVARAAGQARDVLGLARRLGRPPGVYVLSDVLLEYQLTRDSDARPLLAGLLDPLDSNADLVRTVEAYFAHDLDRRSTAGALHVHPNTLDYRLRRIGQLTGLDLARPSGQQLLAAALTARRLGDGATG